MASGQHPSDWPEQTVDKSLQLIQVSLLVKEGVKNGSGVPNLNYPAWPVTLSSSQLCSISYPQSSTRMLVPPLPASFQGFAERMPSRPSPIIRRCLSMLHVIDPCHFYSSWAFGLRLYCLQDVSEISIGQVHFLEVTVLVSCGFCNNQPQSGL